MYNIDEYQEEISPYSTPLNVQKVLTQIPSACMERGSRNDPQCRFLRRILGVVVILFWSAPKMLLTVELIGITYSQELFARDYGGI